MHRTWLSLPLFTSAVSAFYPYHDGNTPQNDKRFIAIQPFSGQPQDDLVTVDITKVYHKRDNKFNIVTSNPPSVENSIAVSQDGSDFSYISSMNFGSKGKAMYMLIDTGSANTWVMAQNCPSKACTTHNLFGSDDSTTLNATTKPWSLTYGTGTVSGVVATDNVKFANFSLNLGFGLATITSDDFNSYPMDGILGLGRATSNELGIPTVMESLKTQGKLQHNILGIHLNRGADNTKDGEMIFGGVNTAKYAGEISYTKTSNQNAWEIPVGDVFISDTPCNFAGKTAIIDTGTSYILMPPADAKKLHSLIPGSDNSGETYTVPCDSKAKIQVSFSGVKYTISSKDFIGGSTNGNTCRSNIVGHQAFGPNEWILGDVFLKNVYAVFDFDQARIGFGMPGAGGSTTGVLTANSATPSASATLSTSTRSGGSTSSTSSSQSSTSSSSNIGNPFDVSSSTTGKNGATVIGQSYGMIIVVFVTFFVGLIV